jgi:tryptophan synthase alpha chain
MSSQRALDQGAGSSEVISRVADVRGAVECGLVAMTYVNPVHRMGYEKYARALADAGFDGVIVPDLPPEEGGEMYRACAEKGVDSVRLVAPTSPEKRISLAAEHCSGFLYCVSLTGVTGARQALSDRVRPFLERVRSLTALPLALGFGVSTTEHVREVADLVDGVIVGSAIVDVIHGCDADNTGELVRKVTDFVTPLVEAAERPR